MKEANDYFSVKGVMYDLKNISTEAKAFMYMVKNNAPEAKKEEQSFYFYFSDERISEQIKPMQLLSSDPFLDMDNITLSNIEKRHSQNKVAFLLEGIRLEIERMKNLFQKVKSTTTESIDLLLDGAEHEKIKIFSSLIKKSLQNFTIVESEIIDGTIFLRDQAKKLENIDSYIENLSDFESLSPKEKDHPGWIKIFYRLGFIDLKQIRGKYIWKAKKGLIYHLYAYVKDTMSLKTYCTYFVDQKGEDLIVNSIQNNFTNDFPEKLSEKLNYEFSITKHI
jgi:hypothetical protein